MPKSTILRVSFRVGSPLGGAPFVPVEFEGTLGDVSRALNRGEMVTGSCLSTKRRVGGRPARVITGERPICFSKDDVRHLAPVTMPYVRA